MATAQPVATVVAVTGTAYARDAEGRMRLLRAGDAINEGETVVTSSGGRVELAFEDGSVLPVEQNQSIAVTAELSETSRPQALDAQLGDASIAQVIQALNDGGNLDDALEAPAAGLAGGGGGEGNNFVRLLRITEGVDPLAFDFAPTEPDRIDERLPGAPEADDGTPATTTTTPPSTVPAVTVDLELGVDGSSPTLTVDAKNATSVTLTITGSDGSEQTAPVTQKADGTWTVDTSGLTFNEEVSYTATAIAKDNANNTATDTDTDSFDLKPEVEVDLELGVDGSSPTLTVDAKNATSVTLTITGSDGSEQTAPVTQKADGTWTVDTSGLTFNEAVTYTATAIAKDNVNNTATAVDSDSFDLPPAADGGAVAGVEDSSYVFQWSDFKVSDGATPASSLGIVINTLPVNGKLEYLNAAGDWVAVSQGQEVSQADIAAGHLRFTPAANESGSDAYGGTGVGDQQGDYARFEYSPTDGTQVGDSATMVVDIAPVADAPTLSVTVGAAHEVTVTPAGTFSGTLNASNLLTTSGVSVSAKNFVHNPDGTYSLSSASSGNIYLENTSTTGRIGVAGNHPGASSQEVATGNQIGYSYTTHESEELIFTFQSTVTTASATISNLWIKDNGKNATEVGIYELYRDGVLVGTGTFNGTSSGNLTVSMTANDGLGFDTVVFKAASSYLNMTTAQSVATGDGSDYYITSLTYQGTTAPVKAYTYALDIDAALVDADGSESLSGVSISGIPSGATLTDGTHTYTSTDSSHSLLLDGWNLDSLVITTSAGSTTDFTLQVSVSSSEHANGDTATTTTAVTVVVGAADAVAPAVHLTGGAGDDHITGGIGDDVIAGGAGSDILAGGLGADTFIWSFGDQGAEGKPEVDRVLDFDTSSDKLDLHDLLQGESASGGNLGSFLFVEHQGADTVIHVSTQGGFTSGYDAGKEDQTIVLQGVDLVGGLSSQAQILQNLVDHGKLITD
ncbi:retention module-containing protein [Azoarcus indigens]|uniref:Putative secreted protein (Type I secretion substrate) n=1 Tax=Azoarcus indigens TaxID=29545 RepID=A0A4R6E6E3_9RHOO|nr:retention module-containing protein [Azoarcus indigens]NMG67743.1 retention module-containing protein [Azoarcus indigens]TDN53473.1 putative secreted protein (type I secretion substrate) [Azoarcus indigens]